MRNVVTRDSMDPYERNLDRISSTVDGIDVRVWKFEEIVLDLRRDMKTLQESITLKTDTMDFKRLEDKVNYLPNREKIKSIENRFQKYALNDSIFDLKTRVETIRESMDDFASK
jgi:hypothetical protein